MENGFVLIKNEVLQKLLKNFYHVCNLTDELNIYEHDDLDQSMQEMKSWAEEKFGMNIEKQTYE